MTTDDGERFVLKVMHPSRERGLVDLQCRALDHVAARVPTLPLQRVKRSMHGEPISIVELEPGAHQAVWAVTFIVGKPFAEAQPQTASLREELGEFMGELSAALADFAHPAAERILKWDLARAAWINEHQVQIADLTRRAIVTKFMDRFASEVLPALPSLRRSIIHGDANDYNLRRRTPSRRNCRGSPASSTSATCIAESPSRSSRSRRRTRSCRRRTRWSRGRGRRGVPPQMCADSNT